MRAWMGALHCVSVEDFAQLLDRRCDTVRHWLAGSKTPSPALREDLREIEAGIEDGARAAVEDGEADGVAEGVVEQAVGRVLEDEEGALGGLQGRL